MISSFFGKTKPINYAVLSTFLIVFYACLVGFSKIGVPTRSGYILEGIALIALIFELIVINEIVRSEKVTGFSSFSMAESERELSNSSSSLSSSPSGAPVGAFGRAPASEMTLLVAPAWSAPLG